MAFLRDSRPYQRNGSLKIQKTELRNRYLAERKSIPEDQKKKFDSEICKRIIATASFRFSTTVLVYSALPSEIDLGDLIREAYSKGKRVVFPRCIPGTSLMEFHEVDNLDVLKKGSFSIMEPPADAPVWKPSPADRAVCVIPAVLFDVSGHRIGYGKGFYDRYLSGKSGIQRIGVAYDRFITESVPHGRYDLSVDFIVSEKRLLSVKK